MIKIIQKQKKTTGGSCHPDGSGTAKRVSELYATWRDKGPDEAMLSLEESASIIGDLINPWSQTATILDALDECSQPYPPLRSLQQIIQLLRDE